MSSLSIPGSCPEPGGAVAPGADAPWRGATVEVRSLSLSYRQRNGDVPALAEVSFDLGRSETCAVIGPSGCGKTSLLYALAGLRRPAAGEVLVNGSPVSPKRRETALILQDYGLLPWKTVRENVALGLQIRGLPRPEREREVAAVLDWLGLGGLGHRYPAQLSGGQRQRVGIARALALDPDLLLMDEPFSSLDALTREELQNLLLEVHSRRRPTLLLVTHSIEEAIFLGRRILIFSPGPGRISHVLDNPRAGDPAYRGREEFHRLATAVRRLLDLGRNGGGNCSGAGEEGL